MVRARSQGFDRLEMPAQLVRDHDARLTKVTGQPSEKPFCRLCIAVSLDQNIQDITIRSSPEPEFLATDGDDHFIQAPLVVRGAPVPANAIRKMASEPVVRPDGLGDHFAWVTETFEAQERGRHFHLRPLHSTKGAINLAMTSRHVC